MDDSLVDGLELEVLEASALSKIIFSARGTVAVSATAGSAGTGLVWALVGWSTVAGLTDVVGGAVVVSAEAIAPDTSGLSLLLLFRIGLAVVVTAGSGDVADA